MDNYQSFKIGINVFLINNNNQLLLGKRKNVFGDREWGLPGGHLEFGEEIIVAGKREVLEETGIKVDNLKFINIVNDVRSDDHRLQIGLVARNVNQEPQNLEPDRCYEWNWFDIDTLPSPIFSGHIEQIKGFISTDKLLIEQR